MLDSIGDALALTATKYPNKTALIEVGGERFTYDRLNRRVNRLANALLSMGFTKGDKIAYLFANTHHFVECHFAVAKTGGVGVPLNVRLVGRELAYQIENSDAVCVIYSGRFADAVNQARIHLTQARVFICDGDSGRDARDYEPIFDNNPDHEPEVDVTLYDDNIILYTAGTTGTPKGAVLRHKNSLFNAMTMVMGYRFRRDEVFQVIPPLFHSASLNAICIPAILTGATLVLHPRFEPKEALAAIQEERITITWGPATLLRMLIGEPEFDRFDTTSVRLVINGAMYMPAEMRRQMLSKFPSACIADTYGMTEASPCCTILPPDRALDKPASVGLPLSLCDVKIFGENGEELGPGEVGEIVTRGNFMRGYYEDAPATAEAIRNGWFYTGDLGKKDEEAFIYLVDRKKDMISTGGGKVYSPGGGEGIGLHPHVFEAAVIGVPDEKWGEAVAAVVAVMPGTELTEEDLAAHCRLQLADYKRPRIYKFVESLPKSAAGKVLKREIKKTFTPKPEPKAP